MKNTLPPGQFQMTEFPRFGLPQFASRFREDWGDRSIRVIGDIGGDLLIDSNDFNLMKRVSQVSDFHCVTTWSALGLRWSGFRFSELFLLIGGRVNTALDNINYVVFRGRDGYKSIMRLEDLMADDVLLADTLDEQPLSPQHGAPLRLVAPRHYGYKSVKHIKSMELLASDSHYRFSGLAIMEHPRGRVDFEERGKLFPGYFFRYIYRLFVNRLINRFKRYE